MKKSYCKTVLFSFLLVFAVVSYGYAYPIVEEWANIYDSGYDDRASDVALDTSNNVYVTGSFFNGSNYDALTVKYNSSGAVIWARPYSTANDDFGNGITVDGSGNVYVAGDSCGSSTPPCSGFILKYNSSGTPLSPWNPKTPGGIGRCSDIKVDSSGNVYVAGPYRSSSGAEPDFRLLKYNQYGTLQCSKTYDRGFGYFDFAEALALDASGNYVYVTGESYNGTDFDYLTLKYSSSSGCPLSWARIYNSGGNDFPYDIAVSGNNQIYVTGDTVTIKYDSSGNALVTPLPGTGIAVDGSGYVYVVGYASELGYYGITKADSSVNELWFHPLPLGESAYNIAVDSYSNLYVTGNTYTAPNQNILTAKYQQVPLSIVTDILADGTIGTSYSQTLAADGGASSYIWSVIGNLPNGLTLNPETGEISGTPTTAGTATFTVQARDLALVTAEKALSITIYDPLIIISSSPLPDGLVGRSYSNTLTVSGGQPGYTWYVTGYLPNGLELSASGVISGTPTETGTFAFTVWVTDTRPQPTSKEFLITIHENLTITTTSLPSGTVGTSYTPTTLEATGGETPYAWSGNMPAGLTISSSTGEISGTPKTPGIFSSFIVQVRDTNSFTTTKQFTVQIDGLACSVPVKIEETPYDSTQAASTAALDGQTIKIAAMELTEDLEFSNAISVSLKGGHDCEFASNPWNTTIKGTITISAGTVTIENLVLQ